MNSIFQKRYVKCDCLSLCYLSYSSVISYLEVQYETEFTERDHSLAMQISFCSVFVENFRKNVLCDFVRFITGVLNFSTHAPI